MLLSDRLGVDDDAIVDAYRTGGDDRLIVVIERPVPVGDQP
jgi:hypothetical protein